MILPKSKNKTASGRRISVNEMAEILTRINKNNGPASENPTLLSEYNSKAIEKSKKYYSKSAALGAPAKILSLVKENPKLGPKKLARALLLNEVQLTPQSVYRILAKYNLNLRSQRIKWVENLN